MRETQILSKEWASLPGVKDVMRKDGGLWLDFVKIKRFSSYHPGTYTESWVWTTGSWVFPYFSGPSGGWPQR